MADQTKSYPQSQPPPYPSQPGQQAYPAAGQPAYPPAGQPVYPPPGQPMYPAGQQPVGGAPVVVTTTVVGRQPFGPNQMQAHCPTCNQTVVTKIDYENGMMVWIVVGIILLFGGWLGCCLIPFCINDLKNVRHTCPNDNTVLGVYDRSRSF